MLPASWKPIPSRALVRVGAAHDGGYVVSRPAVERASLLVSMGLSDDWSFEEHFRTLSSARVICFDHTITPRFWVKVGLLGLMRGKPQKAFRYFAYRNFFGQTDVEHRRQCIGYDVDGGTSLAGVLAAVGDEPIFLKADIEGSEYRIFDDVVRHADRFTGIAMELHDVDLHRDRITEFFGALGDLPIVAMHANNYGGTDAQGDPLVIEVTLTRRDLVGSDADAGDAATLHSANDPGRRDIELRFEDSPPGRAAA